MGKPKTHKVFGGFTTHCGLKQFAGKIFPVTTSWDQVTCNDCNRDAPGAKWTPFRKKSLKEGLQPQPYDGSTSSRD